MMFTTSGRRGIIPLLLVLIGGVVGVGAYLLAQATERERAETRLQQYLEEKAAFVESEIRGASETLHYLAAFYGTARSAPREEFRQFTRRALARHPEIQAVEWAPKVTADQRDAHVAQMRAAGAASYEIRQRATDGSLVPAPNRPVHFPVAYVEPLSGNEPSRGFDLGSEARWRAALERAVQTRRPALSDPLRLVQQPDAANAVLLFLPVFEQGATLRERDFAHLEGVVLLVWRVEDLMAHAVRGRTDLELTDVWVDLESAETPGAWLPLFPRAARRGEPGSPAYDAQAKLRVAERTLRLAVAPGAALALNDDGDRPLLVGLLTFLLTALVTLLAGLWVAGLRRREERKNLRLTRSLLRTLDQGVIVADEQGHIHMVNKAARMMVGGLGDTLLQGGVAAVGMAALASDPGGGDVIGSLPLDRALKGERFEDEELPLPGRHPSDTRWLRVSGAPLESAGGESLGAVVVFRDITEAKAYEDSIRDLTTAVDRTADVVFITDRDGRILYANRGFETTTGYTREEVLGETPRILKSGAHDEQHYEAFWDTILRGEVWSGTSVNRKKDGTIWYGEQSVTPMHDPDGQVTHFVSVTKDMTERRKLLDQEADMRLAGEIQQRLYPQSPPVVEGLDIAAAVYPAGEACGDYYDFLTSPDGTLSIVIGDVSGHGLGPALIMAQVRAQLQLLLGTSLPLEDAIAFLNEHLSDDIPDDCFVTLLVAQIDPRTRHLTYVNAGHPAALVVRADGRLRDELSTTGPALGVLPGARYGRTDPHPLEDGDVVAFVTDGITEIHAPDTAIYGTERVVASLGRHRARTADYILKSLHASATAFAAGRRMDDDLTLVVCKVPAGVVGPATSGSGA